MKNYYVDTNIWIDLWEDRSDGLKPLGEFAFQFFKNAIENKCMVYYSKLVVLELRKKFNEGVIEGELFKPLREAGILKEVSISKKQMSEARKIASKRCVPLGDALHAIIARDNRAILVSRDAHCLMLQDIVDVENPEEIYWS
jgi:predicted nucleic acid-binding protein